MQSVSAFLCIYCYTSVDKFYRNHVLSVTRNDQLILLFIDGVGKCDSMPCITPWMMTLRCTFPRCSLHIQLKRGMTCQQVIWQLLDSSYFVNGHNKPTFPQCLQAYFLHRQLSFNNNVFGLSFTKQIYSCVRSISKKFGVFWRLRSIV